MQSIPPINPVPAKSGRHPLRGWLPGLGVLLFTSVLLLLVGEGLARRGFEKEKAADARMAGSPIGHDPRFGFKGIPGFNGVAGGVRVRINAHGFRDESWEDKLRRADQFPARPRILLLGDSMTYGYFISKNFRLGEQLESFYTRHRAGAEVFNAAIPGYGPAEQTQVLESLLPVIRPDIVILRYCANDFGDSALPYDYRSPNRVYKPWYTLDGRLALNEPVPRRFSLRARGTFWDRFDLKYAVDRCQYALDDVSYQRLGVYSDLGIHPADKKERTLKIARLGYLAMDPGSADVYARQKRRALTLWSAMRDRCTRAGARFLMTGTIADNATGGEAGLPHDLEWLDIPFLNLAPALQPWQPWSYVEGDGHPNMVDNYVAATALFNRLNETRLPIDFTEAVWLDKIPAGFELSGNQEDKTLRWGPWGKTLHHMRDAVTDCRLLLRNPSVNQPVTVELTGVVHPGNPLIADSIRMRLSLSEEGGQAMLLPAGGPFCASFHFDVPQLPLLFLRIELEKSEGIDGRMIAVTEAGYVQIRRVVALPEAGNPAPVGQTGRIH